MRDPKDTSNAVDKFTALTHSRVKEFFNYDPKEGILRWKIKRKRGYPGKPAGSLQHTGYIQAWVDGHPYQAHRLIWFWMTGKWPRYILDHKDRNKSNNRWDNLREATISQNALNKISNKNKYGHKGIKYRIDRKSWVAFLEIGPKVHCFGSYKTKEEAIAAYRCNAPRICGEFTRFDENA